MFSATFEVLLFACQYEKFYRMYLAIVRGAWEYFELTRVTRARNGHYRDEIHYKIEEDGVDFSITRESLPVFQVAVSNLGMDHPTGKIRVSCTSDDFLRQITEEIRGRKTEFSILIKVLRDEKEGVLL